VGITGVIVIAKSPKNAKRQPKLPLMRNSILSWAGWQSLERLNCANFEHF
jgi:hypothetical protein